MLRAEVKVQNNLTTAISVSTQLLLDQGTNFPIMITAQPSTSISIPGNQSYTFTFRHQQPFKRKYILAL